MAALAIIMAQMGTSASSIAILVAAALAAPASLSGCKKEEQSSAQPASQQAGAPAADGAEKRPKREKNPIFRKRALAAQGQFGLVRLSRDEIKPLVPTLTGARQTARPMVTTAGRQVNVIHCLPQDDPARIKAEFQQKLEALGFGSIRFRDKLPNERPPKELVRVTAEKGQYRLTVAVQSGPFYDCKASEKKVKLVMSFFKRTDQAPAGGQTPAAPATPAPASPAPAPAPAQK